MLKLLSMSLDYGACTHIRIRQVVREIERQNLAKVYDVDISDSRADIEDKIEKCAEKSDLIWFGRSVDSKIYKAVDFMQKGGYIISYDSNGEPQVGYDDKYKKKWLFDLDDYLLDISPWSSHYDTFGTEEFYCDGKAVWKDKVNINLPDNRKRVEEYKRFIGMVGALSVTTPRLLECYKPFANRIYVFPNTVDPKLWNCGATIQRDPDRIKILWQGGVSHYEDFWEIVEVIPEITKKYPKVHWVMMGAFWEFFWKDIPKDRYEYVHWVHSEAYPYRMQLIGADIGIAPLSNTRFNHCKSSIKYYEYSEMNMATVASNVPPYSDDIQDGKNGYLASSKQEWIDKLSRLIEDAEERRHLASEAKRYVEQERSVEVVAPLIVKAMEYYVNGKVLAK